MQTLLPQSQRLRDYTHAPVEIFIAALTILPFLALAYFYPALPERVPVFLNLSGEVVTWGEKSLLTVFRVPLMAVVTQMFCLVMKYGVLLSEPVPPAASDAAAARLYRQYTALKVGLWDGFRCLAALKMCAGSLDTVFLSVERFKYLSRPAFIITLIAALLSVPMALFYGYRLLVVKRQIKERFGDARTERPVDASRVYGGALYFNPDDPALFVNRYVFNFANKWVYLFLACIIAYPLLVFLPA